MLSAIVTAAEPCGRPFVLFAALRPAIDSWVGPSEFELVLFAVLGVLLLGLLVLMYRRSRLMSRIADSLGDLQHGDTPVQIPESGPVSLRGLTRAFNDLARSIRGASSTSDSSTSSFVVPGAMPAQNNSDLVSRLCAELRVPLSAIHGLVEDMLDESQDPMTAKQRERTMRLLANVKSLMDLMQEADDLSEIRRGLAVTRREDAVQTSSRLGSDKILIIEDDEIFARGLTGYLQSVGYEAVHAQTGEAGIAMCQSSRPAAVVLDVLMPGQDAWYVLGELKTAERTKDTPVVLVSNMPQKRGSVVLGADDYLIKPVSKSTLMEKLALWRPSGPLANAMVVAGNENVRATLREFLESEAAHVTVLSSGAELLAQLAVPEEIARETLPQIIFLDLILQDVDGFEVLYQLRANPIWRRIPVLVLTAKHLSTEEQEFLVEGATRVVVEHMAPMDTVTEKVLEWLHRLGTAPTTAPSTP